MNKKNAAIVKGPIDTQLMNETIGQKLKQITSLYPSHEACVFLEQDIRMEYQALDQKVDQLAQAILDLGIKTGDRVGIWSPNRVEWLLTQFATARIGVVLVNINPAYRLFELKHALNLVGCKAIICAEHFKSSNYIKMMQELMGELSLFDDGSVHSTEVPTLKYMIKMGGKKVDGFLNFDEVINTEANVAKLDQIMEGLNEHDIINIQFTSGTTGAPKGASLSHHNILNNGHYVTECIHFNEQDRLVLPVPLYHCFGMVMGVLGSLTHGACLIFPSEAFEAGSTLNAIHQEKATALYGVPTMFIALFEHEDFSSTNMDHMKKGVMAGALCPIEVMRRAIDEMNMTDLTICYGMTETSPVSFQTLTDTPIKQRCETVGKIHPHVEVKIVDEDGNTVAFGEKGELCTRGYSVMKGYWGDEAKTEETIDQDGWLHTGDLAIIDDEGYCAIVGRIKDMIIRGGENIYPREIEDFLFTHPKILQAQVFGVRSEKFGEEVATYIMIKDGETLSPEEVVDYCKGQISHFKVPKYIEFVKEWPATVTGKPQKFLMTEEVEKKYNL